MKPVGDRVVVEVKELDLSNKLVQGFIPDSFKQKPQTGTVLFVGEGWMTDNGVLVPVDVKPGDSVLFGKYSGTKFEWEGKKYLLLNENEILVIL